MPCPKMFLILECLRFDVSCVYLFILYLFIDIHLTTPSVSKNMVRSVEYGTRDALLVRNLGAAYGIRNSQRKL
jgi:hypothetical protein